MTKKKKENLEELKEDDLEQSFDEIKGYRGNENIPVHARIEYTPERIKDFEKCKNNILHFAKNFYIVSLDDGKIPIPLRKYQKRMLKSLVDNRKVIFLASRQIGKALALDTPISTPNGFTTMGELKDGDIVFDEKGNETKILKAHDILYDRKCYEIEFSTGEKIIADSEHLWETQSATEKKSKKHPSVKTSEEIYNSLKTVIAKPFSNHRIKKAECINYSEKDLLIDPYILGYWLGNGNSSYSRITVKSRDFKEFLNIFQNIECIDRVENSFYDYRNVYSAKIKLKGDVSLYSKLRILNLINNKHIPKIYLESSEEQRKELLRGLMDSDGYVCKKGLFEISLSNRTLMDGVKSLILSLGLTITERVKKTTHKDSIAIRFRSFFDCCKLPRKLEKCRINSEDKEDKIRYSDYIYITNMKEVESVPVRCITVDSNSSLFLCGKTLIPTHNSTIMTIYALWYVCFNDDKRVLLVADRKETAIEIFKKIKIAYEQLPIHLKPTLEGGKWNETNIAFDNGSSIKISATSENAFRGQSANCIVGESIVTIKDFNGIIQDISIKELYEKLEETKNELKINLTGYKKDDISNFKVLENTENCKYEILTPTGFQDFKGIFKGENRNKICLNFSNGKSLTCTPKHKIVNGDYEIYAKDLQIGKSYDGNISISKEYIENDDDVYEFLEVKGNHQYIVNGIASKQCIILDEFAHIEQGVIEAFFSSVYPVLSTSKTGKMFILSTPKGKNKFFEMWEGANSTGDDWNGFHPERVDWQEVPGRDEEWAKKEIKAFGKKHFDQEYGNEFLDDSKDVVDKELLEKMRTVAVKIQENEKYEAIEDECGGTLKIFKPYEKDHFYTIGVDTAEGIGQDNSCAQILDITDLTDIHQSAVYTSDKIQPEDYARKVNEIGRSWGTPPLMVESNNVGNVVVKSLLKNFKYPHVPSYVAKQGNQSYGKLNQPGLWMTTNSKSNAVFNMRYYMNNRNVIRLYDVDTIDEFAVFQRKPNGMWGKKKGDKYKDDRVDAVYLALMILLDDVCSKYYTIEDRDDAGKPLMLMPMGGWHVPSKLSNHEFRRNLRNPNYGYGESSYHKYNFAPALIGGISKNRFEKNYELEHNIATSGYFSENRIYTENDYEEARQMYGEDIESLQEEGWEIVNF